jgi:TPR repeat protein
MREDAHVKTLLALLLGTSALTIGTAAAAQDVKPAGDDKGLTVTGQKMPAAEAPRSATCEALVRDPRFRAALAAGGGEPLMGPRPYLPTRLPRNPDYAATRVAAGAALPDVSKGSRFGQRSAGLAGVDGADRDAVLGMAPSGEATIDVAAEGSIDEATQGCRSLYERGGGARFVTSQPDSVAFVGGAPASDASMRAMVARGRGQGRAMMIARDRTLPTALALFDAGRYEESLGWFKKASAKLGLRDGGDEAKLFVGKLYLQGLGAQSDPAAGIKWLKKAATAPYNPTTDTPIFDPRQPERNTAVGEAAVILANVYGTGFGGVAKDLEEARRWYKRAFDVGHIPAAKALGDLEADAGDVRKAAAWYKQAAKFDHAPAQVALADLLYSGGEGVGQDRKAALAWYEQAAEQNHPAALHALARAYDLGDGVKADAQLALGFYKSAALAGSAPAKAALGTYFYEGKIVAGDHATARRWFEAAAREGDADGLFNLAAMLARGEGGVRDLPRAIALMRQAAGLGHQNAPRALAALERRAAIAR